jgi:hypothetical protein
LINRECISHRPESGHNYKAEKDVLSPQKRGTQPEKMRNENTGTNPICIMDLPAKVSHVFKQLSHAELPQK